ncbi:MAG: hypothetical protein ACOZAI_08535 [Pseudomonadota bacterium]
MSRNTLRAQVQCSFQGETHALDEIIDLDQFPADEESQPDFHRHLAKKADIDPISYLYEVLETHDITFSEATGQAADYCHDGQFDWHGFDKARRDAGDWERILAVVQDKIAPHELEATPALKAALLAAYRAGKASAR